MGRRRASSSFEGEAVGSGVAAATEGVAAVLTFEEAEGGISPAAIEVVPTVAGPTVAEPMSAAPMDGDTAARIGVASTVAGRLFTAGGITAGYGMERGGAIGAAGGGLMASAHAGDLHR
jgi:hypothetical protein